MPEIYVIAGGGWLRGSLNAIVTFLNTDSWTIIKQIVTAFSVLIVGITWIRRHNIMDMVGWAGVIVLMTLLVGIRTPVQIIDNSDLTKVYQVDNVPVGLALPASLTTKIGHALVQGYEMVFSLPDSVTYSKTGMIFGANLVSRSTDFLSQNPEITTMFTDYVQNCVMGDIFLNGKYSMEDLMNSADPYTLIFSKPSPLRGLFNDQNQFMTCEEAVAVIKPKLALDTKTGGKTWNYYVRQVFGGRPNPDILFSQMVGDSYNYFYGAGQSAAQIVRQNVTMNALRNGIMSYAARNGDTSSLLNIATTSSMEKQRLAHATVGQVALRSLPMSQTLIVGLMIGIFPLMVLGGMFNAVTLNVLKGYILAIMWVQTWPLLYAILNSCMTYYAKANGTPVVLSELSQVQIKYSDLATTAGYLSMLIPPLAWSMLKGLGAGFSSLYSHLASSAISPATSAASGAVDGNYSYANMQTENVSGFNWNTNSSTVFGQMTQQLRNGATATQTRSGDMVLDSSGAMSRLPMDISATRQIASAQQQMARESESQAQTALSGFNSSISSAWNSLQQFTGQKGNSSTMTSGADTSQGVQENMMASKMRSAVESYAKANNISEDQATQELAQRAVNKNAGLDASLTARGKMGIEILGNGGGLETAVGGKAGINWTDAESHSASSSSRATNDARHDISSQASADFKHGMDYFTSQKISSSGSHSENNSDSKIDQLAASLSSAKSSYSQYSDAHTRSHEYSEMASRTESMTGQMSENLTQQFANYVAKRSPHNAEELLTNTSSPEIASERAALARDFVNEQVEPNVNAHYADNKSILGAGMGGISTGGNTTTVQADYAGHSKEIEKHAASADINHNVGDKVDSMIKGNEDAQFTTQNQITDQSNEISSQRAELKENHERDQDKQHKKYEDEKEQQNLIVGALTKEELALRAKEIQEQYDKKHGG